MFALVLGLLVPALLLSMFSKHLPQTDDLQDNAVTESSEQSTQLQIAVLMDDGTVQSMQMQEYLTCVLLREMPAAFEPEALKAQAVVARTYALKRQSSPEKHMQAAVCTDSSCCQGFCSQAQYLEEGGTTEQIHKMRAAVEDTGQLVLTYQNALIEATYFSCSGGRTEDAVAVWGADIPYLQATDSPGEEKANHYTDTVTFTSGEFAAALGETPDGPPGSWFDAVTYTDGGGVDTMKIGDKTYQGTDLRRILGLRSTAFAITAVGDTVTVTTKGYGHRVGMSQYGADAMALAGSLYPEILAHYYQDTALVSYPF